MNYFDLLNELATIYLVKMHSYGKGWTVQLSLDNKTSTFERDTHQEAIRAAYNAAFPIPKNTYCEYCALRYCQGECNVF